MMSIWFPLTLHGQSRFIEHLFLELAIKGSYGTADWFLFTPNDNVWRPALGNFFFNVGLLFLWQDDVSSATPFLIFFILLVVFEGRMAFFQEINDVINRCSRSFQVLSNFHNFDVLVVVRLYHHQFIRGKMGVGHS
ncbi:hypothetical protein CU024_2850 [Enterococcus faecium]|nr:hypothetical protein [Enterococcus faecium]MBL4990508.1 hypothetical protein [Enterococcus lactis]MBK4789057.1 hypothetical protein [Enterococcus faecium]MBK4791799.1 hypothetical protein [Enterococcus faecium]MBK4799881.1 hypothetical protein [Enterococcus faecium]